MVLGQPAEYSALWFMNLPTLQSAGSVGLGLNSVPIESSTPYRPTTFPIRVMSRDGTKKSIYVSVAEFQRLSDYQISQLSNVVGPLGANVLSLALLSVPQFMRPRRGILTSPTT